MRPSRYTLYRSLMEQAGLPPKTEPEWREAVRERYAARAECYKASDAPDWHEWSNGTKATGPDGHPLTLYHGTDQNIEDFDPLGGSDFGTHLGTAEQANDFVRRDGGRIYPVHIQARNPLRLPDMERWSYDTLAPALAKLGIPVPKVEHRPETADMYENMRRTQRRQHDAIASALEQAGHDSIVYQNEHEGQGGDSWIVFRPHQIRSAAVAKPARYAMTSQEIDEAVASWKAPSEAQIDAENYRKPRIRIHGLEIAIENPKGTRRKPDWPELSAHYGYVSRVTGQSAPEARDEDKVDVFVGPTPRSEIVFVIDQEHPSGRYDEPKVMLGFTNEQDARRAYLASYSPGWHCGPITAMTVEQFKSWLQSGDTKSRVADQVSRYTQPLDRHQPQRYAQSMSKWPSHLFRAADDNYVTSGTSFSESPEHAAAYLNNPGFGGHTLWRVPVRPQNVLDLADSQDLFADLSQASGLQINPAEHQHHPQRAIATSDELRDSLAERGYHWVRFPDDFPEGSTTWAPIHQDAVDQLDDVEWQEHGKQPDLQQSLDQVADRYNLTASEKRELLDRYCDELAGPRPRNLDDELAQVARELDLSPSEAAAVKRQYEARLAGDVAKVAPDQYAERRQPFGRNSKVRHHDTGDLLHVYHGTTSGDFEEFDPQRLGQNTGASSATKGFFFTDNPEVASDYTNSESSVAPVWEAHKNADRLQAEIERHRSTVDRLELQHEMEQYPDDGKADEARVAETGTALREARAKLDQMTSQLKAATSGAAVAERAHQQNRKVVTAHLNLEDPLEHDFGGEHYRDVSFSDLLDQAKANGHDGAIFRNVHDAENVREPSTVYVAFHPKQIKKVASRSLSQPEAPNGPQDPSDSAGQ